MFHRISVPLLLPFALALPAALVLNAGCTSTFEENEENDSGSVVDSSDTVVEIIPKDGFYDAELVAFTLDDCEMESRELLGILEAGHGYQFVRTGSKVTMFLVQRGEVDDESFACEGPPDELTCLAMSESEDRGGEDHEAILVRKSNVTIGWKTNIDIAGLLSFSRECIGVDCEELLGNSTNPMPELPCQTSLLIEGAKRE